MAGTSQLRVAKIASREGVPNIMAILKFIFATFRRVRIPAVLVIPTIKSE